MTDRNDTLNMLKTKLAKEGVAGSINPIARILCGLLDHFNRQHWYDRDSYNERIKKLEAEVASLRSRQHRIETRGDQE